MQALSGLQNSGLAQLTDAHVLYGVSVMSPKASFCCLMYQSVVVKKELKS